MYHKNRGSARIVLAGGGLLSLLIVVVIISYMGGESAKTAVDTKKRVENQVEGIQKTINERTRKHNEMIDRMQGEGSCDVILEDAGDRKIVVIKVVRLLTKLGLKDAEDLVESAPATILTGLTKTKAQNAKRQLEQAGASVRIDKRRE